MTQKKKLKRRVEMKVELIKSFLEGEIFEREQLNSKANNAKPRQDATLVIENTKRFYEDIRKTY